jgi:glycosyltransferase involved in cell wall biosynthesis
MKVSIITVVFNGVSTIEDTIKCILGQTYKNIEYIVIDGGSNDGTLEVIEKYKKQISVVISEKDEGIYDAMNKGIMQSTGEIIGILNADDIYSDQNVVEKIVNRFEEINNLDVSYSNLEYVVRDNVKRVIRFWKSCPYYPDFFKHGHVPPHPTLFVHRRIYAKFGLYNSNFKVAADYEFMLRIFTSPQILKSAFISEVLVKMRVGGESNKNIKNIIIGNKEIYKAWITYHGKFPFSLLIRRIYSKAKQFLKHD